MSLRLVTSCVVIDLRQIQTTVEALAHSFEVRVHEVLFLSDVLDDFRRVLCWNLKSFHSDVYVFRRDGVEGRQYGVSADDLPRKVELFECLQLQEAVSLINRDPLFFNKLFEFRLLDVLRCWDYLNFLLFVPEKFCANTRV